MVSARLVIMSMRCDICKGRGFVDHPYRTEATYNIPCPACNGSGWCKPEQALRRLGELTTHYEGKEICKI